MIRKYTNVILIISGIGLLMSSGMFTYVTLAGSVEREMVANGTTTYGTQFARLMFGFEIPFISIQSWFGITAISMAIFITPRK